MKKGGAKKERRGGEKRGEQHRGEKRGEQQRGEKRGDTILTHITHARRHPYPRSYFMFFMRRTTRRYLQTCTCRDNLCTVCGVSASLGRNPAHGAVTNQPGPRDQDPPTGS